MKELKQILLKLLLLLADILMFAFNTVKQVILPNRRRKGNLLSSLFIFFIGLVERLNYFEHGIFTMSAVFRKKYIRQGIFIIGGILFLLSLFEWTGNQRFACSETTNYTASLSPIEVNKTAARLVEDSFLNDKPGRNEQTLVRQNTSYHSPTFNPSVSKFLLLRCIRV